VSDRSNLILGIVNAFITFITACAAVYALHVASTQVSVAQDQLQATYLSNLYTKQIDGVGGLETALDNFSFLILRDAPALESLILASPDQFKAAQSAFRSHHDKYVDAYIQFMSSANLVKLTLPKSLQERVESGRQLSLQFLLSLQSWADASSGKSADAFGDLAFQYNKLTVQWRNELFSCTRGILQAGKAITDKEVQGCKFTAEGAGNKK
jgi:hypothetical protein